LPESIPAKTSWSMVVYDNQTRSMLQTDQEFPSIGSQREEMRAMRAIGSDGSRQGLERRSASLQPALALVRQDLATGRIRSGAGIAFIGAVSVFFTDTAPTAMWKSSTQVAKDESKADR
jgi:hypothetical protein